LLKKVLGLEVRKEVNVRFLWRIFLMFYETLPTEKKDPNMKLSPGGETWYELP